MQTLSVLLVTVFPASLLLFELLKKPYMVNALLPLPVVKDISVTLHLVVKVTVRCYKQVSRMHTLFTI